ncbi:transcription cofactor vestigial-like protein 2b [Chanos chanos]|uniref:Transcription cofactor vestigial-like protein 2b n=1 Tax=Chanos chanos TaxID=29144 RepID=A0A6J2WFN8_CHACN|nr:transcription cofactor vestigial-like protein 2 [Chanos chanos]
MSCLDVMYPAYGHYTPYAPAASAFISSLPTSTGLRSPLSRSRDLMESAGTPRCSEGVPVSGVGSGGPSPSSTYPSTAQLENSPKAKHEAGEAEYLNSRCVLFTYYQGDISTVVDEHFSRALSSYMEGEGKRRPSDRSTDTPSPSSRRSFPPSFWDSNYPSPPSRPHCDPGAPTYSMDPYAQALHPGLPHPHPHPSESWGYPQSQAYGPPRPLHELYSPPGLETHYSPLLMPTVRPPHLPTLPGHYDVGKLEPTATWPGLLPPGDVAQTLALNMDPGLQHHKKGKELYWF